MNNWTKEISLQYMQNKFKTIKTAMLTTYNGNKRFQSRPIRTADVDSEGNIWFFTNEYLPATGEISIENTVSLTYSNPLNHTYLSVLGEASVVNDMEKMILLWTPFVRSFFTEGLDDPKITLFKVNPVKAEYWENGLSNAILLFNLIEAA
jgi:general stress protein 26